MILLVNGPNLNLLGEREPEVYGRETLADVERMVIETCAPYGVEVKAFQSNWEGALIDFLQEHRHEAQGVILNPGAFTHTSRALSDCLRALPCPTIEVHISNIHSREGWRHESFVASVAKGQIVGLGVAGYCYAALHLCYQLGALSEVQSAEPDASATEERSNLAAAVPEQEHGTDVPESAAKASEGPKAPDPERPWLNEESLGTGGAISASRARRPAEPTGGSSFPAPPASDLGDDLFPEQERSSTESLPRGEYEPL